MSAFRFSPVSLTHADDTDLPLAGVRVFDLSQSVAGLYCGLLLAYGSFTAGTPSPFAGVILNKKANLDMAHIPYNGTGPAVQNLVGGQIHATFAPALAVAPLLEGGKLKILATTSPERRPNLPEDLALVARYQPPIVVTALGSPSRSSMWFMAMGAWSSPTSSTSNWLARR